MSTPTATISQCLVQKTANGGYIIVATPLNSDQLPMPPSASNLANTTTYATFALAVSAIMTMFGETTA